MSFYDPPGSRTSEDDFGNERRYRGGDQDSWIEILLILVIFGPIFYYGIFLLLALIFSLLAACIPTAVYDAILPSAPFSHHQVGFPRTISIFGHCMYVTGKTEVASFAAWWLCVLFYIMTVLTFVGTLIYKIGAWIRNRFH